VIYKASCKQSYFILIKICDAGRLINYHSCPSCWVQDFISAYVFQDKHHLRPHVVIHGIAIFIILRLVPTRLDRFLAKYLWDYVTTPPSRPLTVGLDTSLLGTDEVKATKLFKKMKTGVVPIRKSHPLHWSNTAGYWQGKDGTSVRIDEDQHTYDWTPTRRKSSSSSTHSVYIQRDDGVVMTGFQQYKSHPHAFHPHTHEQYSTWRYDDHYT
jgi:hypothetical protein